MFGEKCDMSISESGSKLYKESKRIINDAKENGQLVLFVGAGASADSGMPLWSKAIEKIAEKMPLTDKQNDPLKIPQYYFNTRGKKEYTQLMRDIFRYGDNLIPTELHKKILQFETATIITTNYDHLIERAAEANGEFMRVISKDIDMPYRKARRELIKMHGDFENDNFVLKEDDYLNYSHNFKLIETYIKSIIGSKVVLFMGYSLNDPDVKHIISWVKDILKDDFQRAYLILTRVSANNIEREYFKNLGINLIYGTELVKEKESTHSEQLIDVLEYLLMKEQGNNLDMLYTELKPMEDLNYVYGKYIANAFRKQEINCSDDESILLVNGGEEVPHNALGEAIWKVLQNEECDKAFEREKINSIIRICEKSRFSEVIRINGKKRNREKLNNKRCRIEELIFKYDFDGLRNLLKENNENLSPEKPEIYMQQAFIYAFFYDYSRAYNALKLAAQAFYARKSYVWYFIAEFNRKYVGRIAVSSFGKYEMSSTKRKIVGDEIKALDLERIFQSIPNSGDDSYLFLQELKNFTVSSTLFYNIYADSLKTNEEATTKYTLFIGTAAYEKLRNKVRDFDRYETCNYIILDRFTENKSIFDLYIRTILSAINFSDMESEDDEDVCGNIKPESLTDFDLYIILRYMQQKEMKTLFKEFDIKKLPVSDEGAAYLQAICKSICNEDKYEKPSIYETDRFWVYLALLSHVEVTDDMVYCVFERLNRIKDMFEIRTYKNLINNFIVYICDETSVNNKSIYKLAKQLSEKLVQYIVADKSNVKFLANLLNNLIYFISRGDSQFDNRELIQSLIDEKQKLLLFNMYPFLDETSQKIIQDSFSIWIPEEGNAEEYVEYCRAVLSDIKLQNKEIESKILLWISTMEQEDRKDKFGGTFPCQYGYMDVLREMVNLFLEDKVCDVDLLKTITEKTSDEMSKWLLDMNTFDYEKFECSWLLQCSSKLLESIAENKIVCENIRSVYKKQYDTLADRQDITDKIVKYFM